MARLYALFQDAPVLGSLIDPRSIEADLIDAGFGELEPLLVQALDGGRDQDDEGRELGVVAQGVAKAAELLAGRYTLVATNVPYLGRGKQDAVLKDYSEKVYPQGKADLATCFICRCIDFASPGATIALVTPQNWWFLGSYFKLRKALLTERSFNFIAALGEEAWRSFGDRGPVASLVGITNAVLKEEQSMMGIDAISLKQLNDKLFELRAGTVRRLKQFDQYRNPDSRLVLDTLAAGALLSQLADYGKGSTTGDRLRFVRGFWEVASLGSSNQLWLDSPSTNELWGGREHVTTVSLEDSSLIEQLGCWIRGQEVFARAGVAVNKMRDMQPFLYAGEVFDDNIGIVAPSDPNDVLPLWAFIESGSYLQEIRKIDKKRNVTAATLVKVPFDLAHWQQVAAEQYPNGLPKPHSDDPTQWLFDGYPFQRSAGVPPANRGQDGRAPVRAPFHAPLQVAVARLLGYRWPRQTGSEFPDCPALGPDGLEVHADADGIVCLTAINRELPAAVRLRALLAGSAGVPPAIEGSPAVPAETRGRAARAPLDEQALLAAAGATSRTLEDWLRDEFFEQHCKLFHHRPFIWHLWDGRKDGFHALVNYHRLDRANLEKLTYSYLGDWIRQQDADAKADKPGAAERLGAARVLEAELVAILEGEPPYDLFIRWKPLAEQPLGWQPDINDGVRLNIRPFMQARDLGKKGAGILRAKPNIKWDKDRGTEPQRDKSDYPWFWHAEEPPLACPGGPEFTGNRWNLVHLTLARKRAAHKQSSRPGPTQDTAGPAELS
jgi:hypothetical protein